jgi:hypothetical protein
MRSPCCLSIYPSVSVHLSMHPLLIFEACDTYQIGLFRIVFLHVVRSYKSLESDCVIIYLY